MRRREITAQRGVGWLLSASMVWAVLFFAVPARAYHLDRKTQTISITSLRDFDKCQKDYDSSGSEACLDALKAYIKKHPQEAFDAGKRARLNFMHWVALDFFAQALTKRPSKERCADPDVSAAVISGLSLPPHYPAVAVAQKLLRETCWAQLSPVVTEELNGALAYFRDNTCSELAARNVQTPQCKPADPKLKAAPESAVARLATVDVQKLSIDPSSTEALRGPKGEEVLIARTRSSLEPYVLIKFKGVRGPFNEQVLVALERSGGIGKDYVISLDQSEWVVLTERAGQYKAFPKEVPDGFWVYPNRPSSKEALKLPTHSEIAREFATVGDPGR